MDIIINDMIFEVGVASVKRTVRREEKYNLTTEDGRRHREVRAVYLDFILEVGDLGNGAYQELMELLTGEEASGDVTLAVAGETFAGYFDGITDEVLYEDEDGLWWDRLSLSFTGSVPLERRYGREDRFIC